VRSKLAAAREELGWSQARLVSELERRGRTTGMPVMSTASLKTALSRWENGHFLPDQHHRRLLRDIFGLTDVELGFVPAAVIVEQDQAVELGSRIAPSTLECSALADASADLRRRTDQLLNADAATCVEGLEQRVSLQAQDCVRVAPLAMLGRLLSDFEDVQAVLQQPIGQPLMLRVCETAADLSTLIGDELMVLGRPADSQAWYTTAKAAAVRTGSPRARARALSLNALLYLYYGTPSHAVALAQETYALEVGGPATALAASVEAFAQAQLGNELAARRALRHSEELFKTLTQEDSVFGFTERRQLFYRGRALLRIGNMTEARAALKDALSSYPLDVVGDPAVLRLDLAERLVTEGDLIQAAELATSALSDLHPDHRAGLFTDAGRRVLTGVLALGRHHSAVQQLDALSARAS
jgi:tetratricopeptide (TPR) repeat protein